MQRENKIASSDSKSCQLQAGYLRRWCCSQHPLSNPSATRCKNTATLTTPSLITAASSLPHTWRPRITVLAHFARHAVVPVLAVAPRGPNRAIPANRTLGTCLFVKICECLCVGQAQEAIVLRYLDTAAGQECADKRTSFDGGRKARAQATDHPKGYRQGVHLVCMRNPSQLPADSPGGPISVGILWVGHQTSHGRVCSTPAEANTAQHSKTQQGTTVRVRD